MMEMEIPQEDLDIAFSEWTEKLDAGSNHWLPAYGYQQPSQLHEALMQQDYLSTDGLNQQSYAYLETIVEETSDDLRSDSEYSADGGWHDTDSETDSVIHVPNNIGVCKTAMAEWGGSERDLAVPKKRRRRQYNNDPGVHDDDDDKDDYMLPPLTSRSSSLLQFETLEKQCDTVFRASASSEQFVHSPSLASSFSFDSLETSRWRFSGSPDSLNEDVASSISSSCSSSSSQLSSSQDERDVRDDDDDDDLLARSYSSRNSATESFKSSLKSHRSFDSLIMCQEKQDSLLLSAELSQSLNNTAIICEEDTEPIAPPRCLYKTVECLTDTGFNKIINKTDEVEPEKCLNENKSSSETSRGQRSAENLSEDSGFGEHIPRGNSLRRVSSSGVFTIAENDDDSSSSSYGSDNGMNNTVKIENKNELNVEDKCKSRQEDEHWNDAVPQYSNSWQSAPDLMKLDSELQSQPDTSNQQTDLKNSEPYISRLDKTLISDNNAITSTTSLLTFAAIRDDDEFLIIPENKSFTSDCNNKMASRHPVVSTPNLYCEEFTVGENEYELKFPDDKRSLSRAHSFKEAGRREGNLRKCKSRGSNIQITTSFINLTKTYSTSNVMITTSFVNLTTPPGVPCKDDVLIEGQGSPASESKVHFSPIVSEVIWNEQDNDYDDTISLDLKNKNDVHTDKKDNVKQEVERGSETKTRRGDRAALPPPPAPPVRHKPPTGISTAATTVSRSSTTSTLAANDMDKTTQPNKHKSGIGGFFQRFSLRRLSSRDKKRKNLKKETLSVAKTPALKNDQIVVNNIEDLQMIIPLHGPSEERELDTGKFLLIEQQQGEQQEKHNDENERQQLDDHQQPPPPPPTAVNNREVGIIEVGSIERRLDCKEQTGAATVVNSGGSVVMSSGGGGPLPPTRVAGLLETDLDSTDTNTLSASQQQQQQQGNKKARSLLNLGDGRTQLVPCVQQDQPVDHRAKSMEFLLDKENKFAAKPPENELQKVGERVMSEHELRVQRSLQRLHVPEWYKNSQVPVQGFLLKRHSEGGAGGNIPSTGWQGLSSKTTSLSSLGSNQAATPRSPSGPGVLSPSPTPSGHTFSRWSTSRLNSNPTSTSTSPCGSARSSFNYRQPYLGWRSQERLTNPRTPAERLAQGLLPAQKQQNVPNLSEVHSSIKEVTSAIVHYVSGSRGDDRLSPATLARHDNPSSRTGSPRGSTGRLCWLESSFVGNRPLDVPETPVSLTATPEHQGSRGSQLYLNLTSTHTPDIATVNGVDRMMSIPGVCVSSSCGVNRPSPGSTTMEDVLDSLLGLGPPASRSPSPSLVTTPHRTPHHHQHHHHHHHTGQGHISCTDLNNHLAGSVSGEIGDSLQFPSDVVRRHSEGCEPISSSTGALQQSSSGGFTRSNTAATAAATGGRRVSFDMAVTDGDLVYCRYTKCNRSAPLAEAKRTFKTCHNCTHVYCSRECRRAHWEKHRKTCLHSRVGALCRKVMSNIKEDEETLHHVSLVARKGFLAKGRGAVKILFSRPKVAEDFVGEGRTRLGEPLYVKWSDLQMEETGKEMHEELVRLCKTYNPDTRLVLYVAVCVVSEVPTSGATVKWEMQVVSRCAKLRLSSALASPHQQHTPVINRECHEPDTLILTSLPGARDQGSRKARQVSFTNIQRHLRQRGISLRRQFPEVYQRLCAYVEGTTERFIPVTIYPRDAATGKNFMCIIMPDAEPEKLELIPTDSAHVQTIDISADPQSAT